MAGEINLQATRRKSHPQHNGADRLPPHSVEMERGVLGCILLSPEECIAACLKTLPGKEAFYDLRHQIIYETCAAMLQAGQPVEIITIQQRLKEDGHLDEIGGIPYLSQLQDTVPSAANLSYYLDSVREKYELRRIVQTCTEIVGRIYDYSGPIEDLKFSVQTDLADVFGNHAETERNLEVRIFDPAKPPPEPTTVFSIGTVGICTAGNIATISAQVKSGKSAIIGAALAATFAGDHSDCLGFRSGNPKGHAVIAIDTEQSPYDHFQLITRAIARAGAQAKPEWLLPYCLTGFKADEIRRSVRHLLQDAVKKFGGVLALLIDGVADAINDVNDPAEANAFVAELHALAIEFNCAIVAVIHLNPGSDFKTRGHLGSQLERKAETNLRLEKDTDETITLYADKNRRAPIPKATGPRFAWSEEGGMHVSVQNRQQSKDELDREELKNLFIKVFSERPAMPYADLKATVTELLSVSGRTAERKIARADMLNIIHKTFAGLYEINT